MIMREQNGLEIKRLDSITDTRPQPQPQPKQ
jgi:hypothetical protein